MARLVVIALRILAVGGATALTFVCSSAGLIIIASLVHLTPPTIPRASVPIFVVLTAGIPFVLTALLGVWCHRRGWLPTVLPASRWRRPLVYCVVGAYSVTAIFGVPAVQTDTNMWAVEEYKRLKAAGSYRVWEVHPYIATYAALPIAPGVVLVYHEYQLGGLYGFGGYELYVWYAVGVKSVLTFPLWVS
jgi:hypothetical protein